MSEAQPGIFSENTRQIYFFEYHDDYSNSFEAIKQAISVANLNLINGDNRLVTSGHLNHEF